MCVSKIDMAEHQRAMMLNSKDVIANSGIKFGTSGARGLVSDFTPEVCAAFTHAFIAVMKKNFEFSQVGIAIDRRPSSYAMAMQCAVALQQLGIEPIYSGILPTPALAYATMQANIPAIIVTGSHIPFDRNGLKFYRPDGEISKNDEQNILNTSTDFKLSNNIPEMEASTAAAELYLERYKAIIDADALVGKHIGIYEHSSAGRDLYANLFRSLGATVTSLARSEEFVPIDTEAVSEEDHQLAQAWSTEHQLDAIFSTDGDGDRPLVADENGNWLRGDILGLLCAKLLKIEALAVPINCNSAIELSKALEQVTRTRIGSPYVIEAIEELSRNYNSVAGFEANGGFLLASDILFNGAALRALPTRDALLPAIMLLANTHSISELLKSLPPRYTASDRVKNFPNEASKALISDGISDPQALISKLGIAATVINTNLIDGLRIQLDNNDIIHLRPSGNAPELRCYAEAATEEKARSIVTHTIAELTVLT